MPACQCGDGEDAAARLFGHPPDATWRYATAEGATAFYVCRYNNKGGIKDFLPLCWFPGDGWRSKHWPAPRPLYNLDKIAAHPDAPVIVCEGEKSADAAARIFPEAIATTSSGGAQSAAKTDWTPLARRLVLIWPDTDSPGDKYAREVAAIVTDLECEVAIIDAAALARIDPNGGARRLPKEGWDADDALADWTDLEALWKAAMGLAKPFEPPAYVSFGSYVMTAKALTVEIEKGRGRNKTMETVGVSAPFEVLGECRDPQGNAWGKALRWRDADDRQHMRHVADAETHGEPSALCASLADQGLWIDRDWQRHFARYLSKVRVKGRLTVVARTGWHDIGRAPIFVLPGETIGPPGVERVILDAVASAPLRDARNRR